MKAAEMKEKELPPKPVAIFTDKALEAAVRKEVYAKRNNDEPITKSDVANISRVIGVGKGIKNLDGLQHCTAIMQIDLGENEIVDLKPLAGLKRVQYLALGRNKITDLSPLKELKAMQLLDLSGNSIKDIVPLRQMENLRTLYLAQNQLKNLDPVAELTKIWSLDASGNQLTDAGPVGKLRWLTTLDLAGNQLSSLAPLGTLPELDMLLISRNRITDLGPLIEMCKKDAEGDRRFAPYLEVYLGGNPVDEKKKAAQTEALKSFGVDVFDK